MAPKRLVELFLQLARIDGVPGKEAPVANHLLSFLKSLGLEPQVDGTAQACLSNTSNVICRVGGGGTFAMVCHMDTLRTTSRLKQVVAEDRITAEGGAVGADGRAGLAAILFALERAVHTNQPLKPFTLAFTTRGTGNRAGARHLQLPAGTRCAFTFDSPLDLGAYTVSSPGVAVFSADILGRAADAGTAPESGVCAISIAARAISALQWGRSGPDTTANIGTIAGGAGTAVVPPAALARGQVRALESSAAVPVLERIREEFEKAAQAAGGAVAFKWSWEYAPYSHPAGSEARNLAEAALAAVGLPAVPVSSSAGTGANVLCEKGVPSISFGVGIRNPRANDEHIAPDSLGKAAELAWQLMKR